MTVGLAGGIVGLEGIQLLSDFVPLLLASDLTEDKLMTAIPGAHTGIAMARLLATVQAIVENSTDIEAKDFDSAAWLVKWLDRPQPSLGGRKPGDLIGTPGGVDVVVKLLGSIESGAFQ